ncbi:PKD domain-containing protein [Niabella drilacis]|uniref:PKD domain-containing protein n=1 Tax=Niabella drilacis (strain DSM 25811 / CCM 8410 / CCUG 62505 / LMG 26954 / E90) TaxID=1285928 RepID=A0A1G6TBY6_NIADE|nr:PKD domain-containing protein [Niabella drilacis]SDD26539.1 PKD domain-containing protein [Niabella drilacis]
MKRNLFFCALFLLTAILSCKKEKDYQPALIAMYSATVTGPKAVFTNMSGYFDAYHWNFGDGDTSELVAPTHVYKTKGKYLVTLTARSKTGYTDTFTDTVWAQAPTITIDGDFNDWDYVEYAYQNTSGTKSNLTGLKTFYSPARLFFLVEGTAGMKLNPFHIYIDADGSPATGFNPLPFPYTAGIEYMIEGDHKDWQTLMKYTGIRTEWSWQELPHSPDFFENKGGIVNVNGVYKIEFSVNKADFPTLAKVIKVGVEDMPNWSAAGPIPEKGGLAPMQTRD